MEESEFLLMESFSPKEDHRFPKGITLPKDF
jgi:hypothetical protein